jgi:uncharacterized protein
MRLCGERKPRMNSSKSRTAPQPTPPAWRWPHGLGVGVLLLLSAGAGWLFERIGAPLPWMIGPLVLTAAIFMGPAPGISVPNWIRSLGQVVVATQVGLAFSPDALDLLASLAPVMVGTALATGLCILAVAIVVARTTGQSLAQAFLSSVPTSPVEAAAMAMAAGIKPMPVIFSQTLRLSAVVIILPFAMYAIAGWPDVQRDTVTLDLGDPVSIGVLAAVGVASAFAFRALRIPNPNFLGPLTAATAIAVTGSGLAPYPPVLLASAQIVLGTWLGATFRRDFVTSALGLTFISLVSSLALLVLCALCAVSIAALSGVDWQTLVLGSAPGGVVEMALTAKFLAQNVVLITTFHLVRIFIFMPNIPWIVRLIIRYENRHQTKAGPQ